MTTDLAVLLPESPSVRRELAVATWLAEKAELSQSIETQRAYTSMMLRFRRTLAAGSCDLDSAAPLVAPIAQAFAAAGHPKAPTHNRRLAVLSSFYRHAIQRQLIAPPNPIDLVARRRQHAYRSSRALDLETVHDALEAIDTRTLAGARDAALLWVALLTGRRASELAGVRIGDLELHRNGLITIVWRRTKGDGSHEDDLTADVSQLLVDYLERLYSGQKPAPEAAVWASTSRQNPGAPITPRAIADICKARLGMSKVHRLRHTFAKLMEQEGATISEIQGRLGHRSAATTSIYLQALTRGRNTYAEAMERRVKGKR